MNTQATSRSTIHAIVHEAIEVAEYENRSFAHLRVYEDEWPLAHEVIVHVLGAEPGDLRWDAAHHPDTGEAALHYVVTRPQENSPRFSFFLTHQR